MGLTRRCHSLVIAAILLCITAPTLADGKFFPLPAYPAEPSIPSQQALIVYRDGIETLIVSSAVQSESPDLGWVIPLPAEPIDLAVADAGVLTSLAWCTRPRVTSHFHGPEALTRTVLFVSAAIMILLAFGKEHRLIDLCVVVLILLFVGSLFLPSLGRAGGGAAVDGIQTLATTRVGNYDVSVVRANDPGALAAWLTDNELTPLDDRAMAIISDYIKQDWCFAVAKLTRAEPGVAATHPMRIRFPVEAPVYPMKLTALAGSATRVELFVIAADQAAAKRFDCVAADRFDLREQALYAYDEVVSHPVYIAKRTGLSTAQPDLMDLMWDGCVLTRLSADLAPEQMDEDVTLQFGSVRPYQDHFYSAAAHRDLVLSLLWSGLSLTFLSGGVAFRGNRRAPQGLAALTGTLLVATLLAAGIAYASLDVRPTRTASWGLIRHHAMRMSWYAAIMIEEGLLTDGIVDGGEDAFVTLVETWGGAELLANSFTGQRIRLERSPGNFAFRRVDGKACLCVFDYDAAEIRIELPPAPVEESPDGEQGAELPEVVE